MVIQIFAFIGFTHYLLTRKSRKKFNVVKQQKIKQQKVRPKKRRKQMKIKFVKNKDLENGDAYSDYIKACWDEIDKS